MLKLLFLSNMYPSQDFPSFGTFVKRNELDLEQSGFSIAGKSVIDKKGGGFLKIFRYCTFFYDAFVKIVFGKFDFIYVHYLTYTTVPIFISLLFVRRRYFINIHGDDLVGNRLIHKIMGVFSSVIVKKSSGIIVPTEYFKSIVLLKFPFVQPESIHVSYSGGVDLTSFKPHIDALEKSQYCWVGRIEEGKGWELLLQAVFELKSNSENIPLVVNVVGGGSQVLDFLDMVNRFKLNDVITYHGEMPHTKLPLFFDRHKFFIFTTERESLGLVLLESLGCGTPAILPDIEPLNQIADETNSIFFKSKDLESLKKCISRSLELNQTEYLAFNRSSIKSMGKYSSILSRQKLKEFLLSRMDHVLK